MSKFELMKDKPDLDTKTLNYVWDMLWRLNYSNQRKNNEQRIRCREREHIMEFLEIIE